MKVVVVAALAAVMLLVPVTASGCEAYSSFFVAVGIPWLGTTGGYVASSTVICSLGPYEAPSANLDFGRDISGIVLSLQDDVYDHPHVLACLYDDGDYSWDGSGEEPIHKGSTHRGDQLQIFVPPVALSDSEVVTGGTMGQVDACVW